MAGVPVKNDFIYFIFLFFQLLFRQSTPQPSNCSQIQSRVPWVYSGDGDYCLLVRDMWVKIYCLDITSGVPKTFVSLPSEENGNYAYSYPITFNNSVNKYRGYSKFSKIGINLEDFSVRIYDFTFAKQYNLGEAWENGGPPVYNDDDKTLPGTYPPGGPPYGVAEGCEHPGFPKGKFRITLDGTGFRVPSTNKWEKLGVLVTIQGYKISNTREVIQTFCSGLCGACINENLKLQFIPGLAPVCDIMSIVGGIFKENERQYVLDGDPSSCASFEFEPALIGNTCQAGIDLGFMPFHVTIRFGRIMLKQDKLIIKLVMRDVECGSTVKTYYDNSTTTATRVLHECELKSSTNNQGANKETKCSYECIRKKEVFVAFKQRCSRPFFICDATIEEA